jgi:glycosyltransferase involved in cell wall biosynthesis
MNKVSVIIPSYNRADLVVETIRNQQAQTLPPFEIIVVDDGSTDESKDVIRSLNPKVTLIEQKNQGPGAARNAGFAAATGEYIQFMDSDDLASLNKLKIQVAALESSNADMAFCPWFHIQWGKGLETRPKEVLQSQHPGKQHSLLEWHLRGWTIVLQNCLFKRSFLENIGPQKTDLLVGEDWEFFNRIFLAEPNAVFTPGCLTLYRLHDEGKLSGTGTSSAKKTEELSKAATYIISNLKKNGKKGSFISHLILHSRLRGIEREGGASIFSEPPSFSERLLFLAMAIQNRFLNGVSRRIRGHAWPSFYHSLLPRTEHLAMMNEAGITYHGNTTR